MNILREQAIELRIQGYSYNMIRERLGVSKSSMCYWFRDISYTPNKEALERIRNGSMKVGVQRHNERVREIRKLKQLGTKEIGKLTKRDLWLLGIGIYIGEGAKTTEIIRISNSDPAIIRLSIKWLKDICGMADNNLSMKLHLYPDNDPKASQEYWKRATGLKDANFSRPSIDNRLDKKRSYIGKVPYGTAHLTVRSRGDPEKGVRLYRRLSGWMAGALNQV